MIGRNPSAMDDEKPSPRDDPRSSAGPSSSTTSDEKPRVGKKRSSGEIDEEISQPRKLTAQEQMQLNLLASLPSMQKPLRDARGRRRSTCVSSEEIVEAGLSALIANHGSVVERDDPGEEQHAAAEPAEEADDDGGEKTEPDASDSVHQRDS